VARAADPWAGLPKSRTSAKGTKNGESQGYEKRTGDSLTNATEQKLRRYYAPHDAKLWGMLGELGVAPGDYRNKAPWWY